MGAAHRKTRPETHTMNSRSFGLNATSLNPEAYMRVGSEPGGKHDNLHPKLGTCNSPGSSARKLGDSEHDLCT